VQRPFSKHHSLFIDNTARVTTATNTMPSAFNVVQVLLALYTLCNITSMSNSFFRFGGGGFAVPKAKQQKRAGGGGNPPRPPTKIYSKSTTPSPHAADAFITQKQYQPASTTSAPTATIVASPVYWWQTVPTPAPTTTLVKKADMPAAVQQEMEQKKSPFSSNGAAGTWSKCQALVDSWRSLRDIISTAMCIVAMILLRLAKTTPASNKTATANVSTSYSRIKAALREPLSGKGQYSKSMAAAVGRLGWDATNYWHLTVHEIRRLLRILNAPACYYASSSFNKKSLLVDLQKQYCNLLQDCSTEQLRNIVACQLPGTAGGTMPSGVIAKDELVRLALHAGFTGAPAY
jgi:hypothetical protein